MKQPSVQNTALFEALLTYVKHHDATMTAKTVFCKRMRVQDSSAATFTLTAQRDTSDGNGAETSLKVVAAWPEQMQIDTAVVAKHLDRNSPNSVRVISSPDSISVKWILRSELYLVAPHDHRTMEIIAWMSKLRFVRYTLPTFRQSAS